MLRAQPERFRPAASDFVVSRLPISLAADTPAALKATRATRVAARERGWNRPGTRRPERMARWYR